MNISTKPEANQPDSGASLPLLIQADNSDENLIEWASQNKETISNGLKLHGAVLFRGFSNTNLKTFEDFTHIVSEKVMDYQERSSPRHTIQNKIYTSTDYPPDQKIFPHNEHSYSKTFPLKLFFYCSVPAKEGGQTPIADCRKILKRISAETINKFRKKNWMYVRNFGEGFGLPWETVFQTENKAEVEDYCRRNFIQFKWKEDDGLQTSQIRPALINHPLTNEEVWFNHLTFFHVTTLDEQIRTIMLEAFDEQDLPNNTYYGDGTPIEETVLDELRQAYLDELVSFEWEKDDIILIDNVLTAHSRNSFTKPREILFAMADPFTRTDIPCD